MEFKELAGVSPEILRAVEAMGFTEMTEVQEKAIPVMMAGRETHRTSVQDARPEIVSARPAEGALSGKRGTEHQGRY